MFASRKLEIIIFLFRVVCVCAHTMTDKWRSEDSFSFHHAGPVDGAQAIKLGSRSLEPEPPCGHKLSH